MRVLVPVLCALIIMGCGSSSSTKDIDRNLNQKVVSVQANAPAFIIDTPHLDDEAVGALRSGLVDSLSDRILKKMIHGFRLHNKHGLRYAGDFQKSNLRLKIDSIWVSRGRFTLDFTHPGPIFTIELKVRGFQDRQLVFMNTYKGRSNLSKVVGSDQSFYWPDRETKNEIKYQMQTVLTGVRPLLGRAYADFLEIDQYQ